MGQAYDNLCELGDTDKEIPRLRRRIRRLEKALEPFAAMRRKDSLNDDDHLVCRRGICEDMTCIFEGDFVKAWRALGRKG